MIAQPRVLVAAERPLKARELSAVLQPEFDIIAIVELGEDVLRACEVLRPDVIVTYLESELLQDAVVPSRATRAACGKLVLVTGFEGFDTGRASLVMGASAHVLHSSAVDELRLAIHAVLRGERHLSTSFRTRRSTAEPH